MAANKSQKTPSNGFTKSSKSKLGKTKPARKETAPINQEMSETMAAVLERLKDIEGRFEQEQKEKQKLEAIIEALRAEEKDTPASVPAENMISRPPGTCSTNWSLQVEMGLAGSAAKDAKYAALLRGMRDLVLNAGVNWEVGWKEIPAAQKGKVFQVARDRYPILKRYINDWATAEMVKQYIKNKRAHHYHNGWLEVPAKYAYLKVNAQKRKPSGSRVKRAKTEAAAKTRAKRDELTANNRMAAVGGKGEDDMGDGEFDEEAAHGRGKKRDENEDEDEQE
ncbi:hypothetical protein BDN70DRAFT_938823 [Pholiota conissans]|uniref:Uncharacterized protein n=1 Tax=Pholiota conissans TaxID=109636 RepID=A0A9P6CTH8_9AGAR|nr:hypothetical protein BDN70DRAFT_938823 [Pholiota conissans]